MNQEKPDFEQQKLLHEQQIIDALFKQYPETDRTLATQIGDMEIIVCGEEPNPEHITTLQNGYQKIVDKIGQETAEKIFHDTRIFLAGSTNRGGGQALPRINAVIMESSKMNMTVGQMEEISSKNGSYRKGDQSKVFGTEYDASELGFVHELGHILEYKAHGDMDRGFSDLDPSGSPTWYGQQQPREDYAESWMFYVYEKPISEERAAQLAKDSASVSRVI